MVRRRVLVSTKLFWSKGDDAELATYLLVRGLKPSNIAEHGFCSEA